MTKERILVVDDEEDILELVRFNLAREGYSVICTTSGEETLKIARKEHPDLIVLDLMLPGIDGLEVAKVLKNDAKTKDISIVMLTAKGEEPDIVTGLELGADDYVTKPFSPRELAARVRAILRRLPGERGPDEIKHGDITLNFLKHEAFRDGKPLNLTEVEFKLLGVLIKEPGRVFSRAQLIEQAMGYDFEGFDRTIDVHILNLRRKLEPNPRQPVYIKTVYGAGYKLSEV